MIERMWINQPSTLQPDHFWHGTNVLVDMSSVRFHERTKQNHVDIYFLSGNIISCRCSMLSLSKGWKQ